MPGRYSFVHWLILRADEPHRPSTAAAFTTVPNAIRCCHLLDIPERGTRVMPNKPLAAAWQVRRRVSEGMAPLDATFLVRSTRGRFEHDRTHAGFGESRPAAQAADRKEAMAQRHVPTRRSSAAVSLPASPDDVAARSGRGHGWPARRCSWVSWLLPFLVLPWLWKRRNPEESLEPEIIVDRASVVSDTLINSSLVFRTRPRCSRSSVFRDGPLHRDSAHPSRPRAVWVTGMGAARDVELAGTL